VEKAKSSPSEEVELTLSVIESTDEIESVFEVGVGVQAGVEAVGRRP
jgi:hypothetical protein